MAGDPNYTKRVLGLHFNGSNGSTAFVDNSPSPKNFTANGNVHISTVDTDPFGGNSGVGVYNGNGDYLEATIINAIGTGDFCFARWIKPTTVTAEQEIISISDGSAYVDMLVEVNAGGVLRGLLRNDSNATNVDIMSPSNSLSTNVWQYVAFSVEGLIARLFVNGQIVQTATITGTRTNNRGVIRDGRLFTNVTARYYSGLADEAMLWKGVAVYTANFTPPYVPFPDYQSKIIGTITESLAADRFIARAFDIDTGANVGEQITTDHNFIIDIRVAAKACIVTVFPVYTIWQPLTSYAIGDKVFPVDPTATPYYYKRLVAGNSGTVEPTWLITAGAQVNDGAQTNAWELVERLIQPITHGPLIPS